MFLFHLFSETYLLGAYSVPDTMLGMEDTAAQRDKVSAFTGLVLQGIKTCTQFSHN